ncbi:MAG: hypothetical protein ACSW8I_00900 [bacterium]
MKKLSIIMGFCLLVMPMVAQQQTDPLVDYRSRFTTLNMAYAQKPEKVDVLYNLALFYYDNSYPLRNLPKAMKFIQRAEECHVKLIQDNENRELARLVKLGITINTLRQTKETIDETARNAVKICDDMTEAELNAYLEVFGNDMEIVRLLRQRRVSLAYAASLKEGTVEAYHHFIEVYPKTDEAEQMEARIASLAPGLFEDTKTDVQVDSVVQKFPMSPSVQRCGEGRKSRMAYVEACRRNTVEAYRAYLERFSASNESQQVRNRLEGMLETAFARCSTHMDYLHFAEKYTDSPLADEALTRFRTMLFEQQDLLATHYYLHHFPLDAHYNDIIALCYSWYSAEGNGEPLRHFSSEYPDFPFERGLELDLERAKYIDSVNLMEVFNEADYERYASYVRQMTGKCIAIVPLQRMIQGQLTTRRYSAALDRVRKFDLCFDSIHPEEYEELKGILSAPSNGRKLTQEFAANYSIKNPVVNEADGSLYFTRVGVASSRICYAVKDKGHWVPAGEVVFAFPMENEGLTLYGFYDKGRRMVLGSEGNIMMAEQGDDGWRITDIPPYPVNTDYLETDAYMLPDGSGMLLASDRPGGYNVQTSGAYFHGDTAAATDLYFIPYIAGGWGLPVNLGRTINTPYAERSPILSRNLKTLYFVTDGHGGLGYGDIYVATRTSVQDWTSWSTPQNAGKEINTGFRESDLSFSPDESRIYMSVNSKTGQFSCYSFPTWHDNSNSYERRGIDISAVKKNLLRIRVADMTQQALSQVVDCHGEGGVVEIGVHKDKEYIVMGDAGHLFVPAIKIVPKTKETPRLVGYSFSELVAMDRVVPLCAVDFAADDALLPIAKIQMEQLVQFLSHHPKSKVEFSIDVADSDDRLSYNRSLMRGRVLRSFLDNRGIDNSRVIISAYGNVNVKRKGASGVSVRFRE